MPVFDELRFLVVDDNNHMRQLVKSVVHAFGARHIIDVADGAEAFRAMRDVPCDLMITDFQMTPLDGVELVRMVRQASDSPNRFLPILMLTGYTERGTVMAARDAGVDHVLAKPICTRTLLSHIQQVVAQPRFFVRTKSYFGPDRRRGRRPYQGVERRKAQPILIHPPQRRGQG